MSQITKKTAELCTLLEQQIENLINTPKEDKRSQIELNKMNNELYKLKKLSDSISALDNYKSGRIKADNLLVEGLKNSNENLINLALDNGADMHKEFMYKETPLTFAIKHDKKDTPILDIFIKHGADFNQPINIGSGDSEYKYSNYLAYAIDYAPEYVSLDTIKKIAEHTTSENIKNAKIIHPANPQSCSNPKFIETPILHLICHREYADYASKQILPICDVLFQHGYNVNTKNDKGKTAIIYAGHARNLEVLNKLVKMGGNLDEIFPESTVSMYDILYEKDGTHKQDLYRAYDPKRLKDKPQSEWDEDALKSYQLHEKNLDTLYQTYRAQKQKQQQIWRDKKFNHK